MTPPAMFAPMYSSFSAPSQQVAPVPSVAHRSQPCCNVQQNQQPTCGPSPFRYVHSPYSFTGYEAHQDIQVTPSVPVHNQTHHQYQARSFPMDVACPPFPTQLINMNCSTTCSSSTTTFTLPRAVDLSHHTQNQPQVHQHEQYLVDDDDVSSEETDESEPLSDSTVVCDHYAHWKRLRSKRGNACFVCRLCSAKWKMPTVQAVNFRAIVLSIPHIPRSNSGLSDHTEHQALPVIMPDPISSSMIEAESETEEGCGPTCQHVSQWKRLRTKRGAAFFVCFECGCKWRTPAPPTQADRRNGWYYHAFPALLFGFY